MGANLWKCVGCGKALPKKGRVWKWRYDKFLWYISEHPEAKNSGYYCDSCASRRESGIDY
jgi:hypothetical protein